MPIVTPPLLLIPLLCSIVLAYAIGCLNTAYYLTRYTLARDIRKEFSGNAGATNAGRILGRYGFLTVLAADITRGALGVLLGQLLTGQHSFAGILLFCTILGHIHPVQLHFRGGKGAACLIGGGLAAAPAAALITGGVSLLLYLLSRSRILSGITGFILFPILLFILGYPLLLILPVTATVLLILFTYYRHMHRSINSDNTSDR